MWLKPIQLCECVHTSNLCDLKYSSMFFFWIHGPCFSYLYESSGQRLEVLRDISHKETSAIHGRTMYFFGLPSQRRGRTISIKHWPGDLQRDYVDFHENDLVLVGQVPCLQLRDNQPDRKRSQTDRKQSQPDRKRSQPDRKRSQPYQARNKERELEERIKRKRPATSRQGHRSLPLSVGTSFPLYRCNLLVSPYPTSSVCNKTMTNYRLP